MSVVPSFAQLFLADFGTDTWRQKDICIRTQRAPSHLTLQEDFGVITVMRKKNTRSVSETDFTQFSENNPDISQTLLQPTRAEDRARPSNNTYAQQTTYVETRADRRVKLSLVTQPPIENFFQGSRGRFMFQEFIVSKKKARYKRNYENRQYSSEN
ncbi:hypothetical protein BDQ17DRAFT_1406229 [Cyathus striatus]|nr:hypothetical protein BDQ17DRAFT_1406229 [Cyathus striatus]